MKLKISPILILCLVLSTPLVQAGNSGRASIQAHATVIPMLGIIPSFDDIQTLTVTEKNDSKLLIQTAKNSELLISFTNSNNNILTNMIVSSEHSMLRNSKNSVIDIVPIDLDRIQTKRELLKVITIIRIDN